MSQFWVNSKRVRFRGIWGTFAPFPGEPDFSWEIGLCYPNCIIALYLPAKFQKKLMSQSWDIECTDVRTYGTEFIGPSRKRGSKNRKRKNQKKRRWRRSLHIPNFRVKKNFFNFSHLHILPRLSATFQIFSKCHFPHFLSPETKCHIMQGIVYRMSKYSKKT